ncbi:hypothetical protein PENTCL1PPCAC_12237, partial [Pristionchus entomophagus]
RDGTRPSCWKSSCRSLPGWSRGSAPYFLLLFRGPFTVNRHQFHLESVFLPRHIDRSVDFRLSQ